jgi:peptide-methionine (S)-S-oxide reductase
MAQEMNESTRGKTRLATLGGGCFWCLEAVLEQTEGVLGIRSGYMGGQVADPTYEQVCTKTTGHVEVVEVTFAPESLSFEGLLELFWKLHDPTTFERQGNDVGPQYLSVIFFHDEVQREAAEESKRQLEASGLYPDPVVTEIRAATTFYEAERYHQGYYRANQEQPYCRFVIAPKLRKLGLD